MAVRISRDILNELVQKCAVAAQQETCGLIFGLEGRVSHIVETPNVAADPVRHFEIDPAALFAALRAERAGGARIIGYWHTHPSGDPSPSTADAASAAPDGRLWLIVAEAVVTAWRAVADGQSHGRFDPVPLDVVD